APPLRLRPREQVGRPVRGRDQRRAPPRRRASAVESGVHGRVPGAPAGVRRGDRWTARGDREGEAAQAVDPEEEARARPRREPEVGGPGERVVRIGVAAVVGAVAAVVPAVIL
ncbi:MAG: Excinuclease ABC, C subunit-like, partial [uncultured Gemmatimonadaceae bacterium]